MQTRILPPDEWPKLAGTEAETIWQTLDPDRARVVVVEHDGAIVGCHILLTVMYAECLWVHPEHRGKASVARRLWSAVQDEVRSVGARGLLTGANDDRVRGLLAHVGAVKMPVDQYIVPVAPKLSADEKRDRKIGAAFHAQLERQLSAENHADDAAHDVAVGRALRLGIEDGRIEDAISGYNAWAHGAGYVPVRFVGMRDGAWVLDMGTAVIAIDQTYQVALLEERMPCPS